VIKAIITDVDGILVGEKIGYNSPHPHPAILQSLNHIRTAGIPIILCSGKPHYSMTEIINTAQLHNPHITDGGGIQIDPIDNVIVKKHTIAKSVAKDFLQTCIGNNIYVEMYTPETYAIQQNQESYITRHHTHILQRPPLLLKNIITESETFDIVKLMPIAKNESDKQRVSEIIHAFNSILSISWGIHPVALPLQFAMVVNKQTSKKIAAKEVATTLGIPFDAILGIGDSTSDWQFMEMCGYVATVENGMEELKQLVKTKPNGHWCIGPNVDMNGFLDIATYFAL
jgi:hydroxymethylpyrimidine pyrophosphatase-like HAD family hydrolase